MIGKGYWFGVAALLLLSGIVFFWLWGHLPQIADENGFLENGQAFFLGVAAVLSIALIRANREQALVWLFFLLFFLSAFLRELEIQNYGLPAVVMLLGSGMGRNLLLGAGWITFLALFLRKFSVQRERFTSFFSGANGLIFLAGCLFLVAGFPFDKKWFPFSKSLHQFFEEILELHGSFLLAQIPATGMVRLFGHRVPDVVCVSDLEVSRPEEPVEEEESRKRSAVTSRRADDAVDRSAAAVSQL